jgi:hypothetical protein
MLINTEVQYTNAFLYSTGQAPTGDACFYVGTVVEVVDELFVRVRWSHDPARPQLVRESNVAPRNSARALEIPSWVNAKGREIGQRKR